MSMAGRRLLLALGMTLALVGCGGGGSTAPGQAGGIVAGSVATTATATATPVADPNAEEPVVTIERVRSKTADATVDLSGFKMRVSGLDPSGAAYTFPNLVVKGAGLQGISQPPYGLQQFTYPYMDLMASCGANCIRTYGADFTYEPPDKQVIDVQAALDWATRATTAGHPMYVAVGLTMLPSSSIDYTNTSPGSPLLQQRANIEQLVDKIVALDNSRQLVWVIGNEPVRSPDLTVHRAVYAEIDVIAQYIKKTKKSTLPCMTALQAVSTDELKLIAAGCPNLDILGVNNYYGHFGSTAGGGFLNTLNATMVTSAGQPDGWQKPYIVSEYASYDMAAVGSMPTVDLPNTPAFTPKAVYGLEASSTQLAADYLGNYQAYIAPYVGGQGRCCGSFAYVWQNPVFSSNYAYFFEIFASAATETPSYNPPGTLRLEAVDKLITAWGGTSPGVAYPQLLSADGDPQAIQCTFKAVQGGGVPAAVSKKAQLTASVTASHTSALTFSWYVVDDTTQHYNPQKYSDTKSNALDGAVTSGPLTAQTSTITFTAPATPGNYQLRVVVSNGNDPLDAFKQHTAASAAILFVVQ